MKWQPSYPTHPSNAHAGWGVEPADGHSGRRPSADWKPNPPTNPPMEQDQPGDEYIVIAGGVTFECKI